MGGGDRGWRDEDVPTDWAGGDEPDLLESPAQHRAWPPDRVGPLARTRTVFDRLVAMNPVVKGVVALAALAAVAVVGIPLLTTGGPVEQVDPAPSVSAPTPDPSQTAEDAFWIRKIPAGRYAVERVAGAVPFSFTVPKKRAEWADGWTAFGDLYVSLDSVGPQAAEAVIYWTGFTASSDNVGVEACGQWWGPPVGRTAANLATAASTTTGTALVTGPSDVTVGGYPAKRLVLTVRDDLDCQPGLLYTWQAPQGGPFWDGTEVGDTVRIWIVDVNGALLYIEGDTHRGAGPELGLEVEQIVESIRFE
jgi:hypothetical protein